MCESNNRVCAGSGKNMPENLQEKRQSAARVYCANIYIIYLCRTKVLTSPGISHDSTTMIRDMENYCCYFSTLQSKWLFRQVFAFDLSWVLF